MNLLGRKVGLDQPIFLIAGPCVIESEDLQLRTAERLKADYWPYVVFHCGSASEVHVVRDPVRLGWEPLVKIEHYHVGAKSILEASE